MDNKLMERIKDRSNEGSIRWKRWVRRKVGRREAEKERTEHGC